MYNKTSKTEVLKSSVDLTSVQPPNEFLAELNRVADDPNKFSSDYINICISEISKGLQISKSNLFVFFLGYF